MPHSKDTFYLVRFLPGRQRNKIIPTRLLFGRTNTSLGSCFQHVSHTQDVQLFVFCVKNHSIRPSHVGINFSKICTSRFFLHCTLERLFCGVLRPRCSDLSSCLSQIWPDVRSRILGKEARHWLHIPLGSGHTF